MEYKKSEPLHGAVDGRHVTLYQYEFPRATRTKGKFLPQGAIRLREFLYCDGHHGQLVQIILISGKNLSKGDEQRILVEKMLDINREDKKFRDGTLTAGELSGELREYTGKKLICLDEVLSKQEKIGMFASARRVKDSKKRQQRSRRWKIRLRIAATVTLFTLGLACGSFLQRRGLFNFEDNAIYQNYVLTAVNWGRDILSHSLH